MKKISFIIPVFRNEGTVALTYQKISVLFNESLASYDYEIIFIDDGSDDGSYNEILKLKYHDSHVVAIKLTRNFGQLSAILAGYNEAKGDAVINISADLQDPIDLVIEMIKRWEADSEVVVGYRSDREDSFSASFFSKLAYGIIRLSNPKVPEGGFDFVLIGRRALSLFLSIEGRHRFFQGDILWGGFATSFIPYVRKKRQVGKSGYNFWKRLKILIDWILDSSYLPIRFMSFLGVTIAFFGCVYAVTIIVSWFFGGTPFSGWAPLMIAVLLIGGLLMLMLGVIGEYVWRIYDEIRKKPNYVIDEIIR
ncbi:MAG: glycosyltransferase family 2 protein [Gammaproteobacteria bacterium]|nr:glycosyltransferase family 2 protein [Gammaproteobacteria bacterium]